MFKRKGLIAPFVVFYFLFLIPYEEIFNCDFTFNFDFSGRG